MKKIILLLFVIILQLSCSNDRENGTKENGIVGTWKLSEGYVGDGTVNTKWIAINNGYTYTFKNDGTFTSTRFNDCQSGNYTLETNLLTLDFDCAGFTTGIENTPGTFIENYKMEKGKIILSQPI
ncbi:lipocalin family protein [Flavobacterium hungaricum]|uniref:Lipocalin-like domain-containing protein n=1 Tax=Flavobacterium hungaricum TaxID=2082725 RepID=A0ABR9TKL9_9FLAO|nr:lipocalin family protein [Flavobacterium hungaricum]MBE8725910.1 hypothetical protein [Flavobacterium hungaricum]